MGNMLGNVICCNKGRKISDENNELSNRKNKINKKKY